MAMDDALLCRPPLVVNMDETAIVRHVSGLRGTVVKATSKTQVAIDRASVFDRRSCISLLASITKDASIQAQLPQVLLGNHHTLTLQVLRSIGERIGSVSLWRQKSAWNSHCTMRRWLALLVKALGPVVKSRYVIVLLDVHPSHIRKLSGTDSALSSKRAKIWGKIFEPSNSTPFTVLKNYSPGSCVPSENCSLFWNLGSLRWFILSREMFFPCVITRARSDDRTYVYVFLCFETKCWRCSNLMGCTMYKCTCL